MSNVTPTPNPEDENSEDLFTDNPEMDPSLLASSDKTDITKSSSNNVITLKEVSPLNLDTDPNY